MRYFRSTSLVLLVLVGAGCSQREDPVDNAPGWELNQPAPDAAPVTAKARLQGAYPVGSRLPDKGAIGGFGPCDNYPFDLGGKDWGMKGQVSLVAFPDEPVAYFKHRGIAVRLVNRSGGVVSFQACDSYLILVQEARDANGRWRAIESPPEALCGNSLHRVLIKPDQYWQFPARVYAGPIKTKARLCLDRSAGQLLYSNEFDAAVSPGQFDEQHVVGE
jgi:hypothetical protein